MPSGIIQAISESILMKGTFKKKGEEHEDKESTTTWGQTKSGGMQDTMQMQKHGVFRGVLAIV